MVVSNAVRGSPIALVRSGPKSDASISRGVPFAFSALLILGVFAGVTVAPGVDANITPGSLTATLGSYVASATTTYRFDFSTDSNWNANGCLIVTFPNAGWGLGGATLLGGNAGTGGTFGGLVTTATTLTVARQSNGGNPAAAGQWVQFGNIVNHATPATYTLQVDIFQTAACGTNQGSATVPVTITASGGPASTTYPASGSYTPPAGVTCVKVETWGGGGGGGGVLGTLDGFSGGGGAGGAYAIKPALTVTPGTPYTVTVGAGGAGGTASGTVGNPGSPGQASWFSTAGTVIAQGGAGGAGSTSASDSPGGLGSTAGSIPLATAFKGGDGGTGVASTITSGGGGGGAGSTGAGGNGGTPTAGTGTANGGGNGGAGTAAEAPGVTGVAAGGGGSGGSNPSFAAAPQAGGPGARGQVVITETPGSCASPCTSTGPPDAAQSTIAASPTLVNLGAPGSTVTVTAKTAAGVCLSGQSVTLTSSSPGTDTISPGVTQTTDSNGQVFYNTQRPTTAGTSTYTSSVTGAQSASVTYSASSTVTGGCTISGSVITCTGTGTYKPAAGVTCVNAQAWAGGGGGGGVSSGAWAGGGGAGGAFASKFVPVANPTTYTVTVGAGGAGGPASGAAPGTNGGDSWFSSTSTVLAKGGGGGGGDPNLAAPQGTPGTSPGGSIGTAPNPYGGGSGTAGTTAYGGAGGGGAGSTSAGANAVTSNGGNGGGGGGGKGANGPTTDAPGANGSPSGGGGSGGYNSGSTAGVGGNGAGGQVVLTEYSPTTANAGTSTVSGSPVAPPADGATVSTITVTAKDGNGCPVPGKTVTLSSSRGATDTVTQPSTATNAAGQTTGTVSSCTGGAASISANIGGVPVTQTASLTFGAPVPTAASSTASSSPTSVPADGATTSTITVTLKDTCGNTFNGRTVTLASSRGANDVISPASTSTAGAGQASFTVKSSCPGSSTLTATDTTDTVVVTQQPAVSFTGTPTVDAAQSTVVASPTTVVSDGIATSTITVTLKTAAGCLVGGKAVTLSSSRGLLDTISGPAPVLTDTSGRTTFTVSSNTAGTSTYTATDTTDSNLQISPSKPTVTFVVFAGTLNFLVQPTSTGAGLAMNPPLQVQALVGGVPYTASSITITLSLLSQGTTPAACVVGMTGAQALPRTCSWISGTATANTNTATGIATFGNLIIDTFGQYKLRATAGPSNQDSTLFSVTTTADWPVFHQNRQGTGKLPSSGLIGSADMTAPALAQELIVATGGSIRSTPLLVDLNGDGKLDLAAAVDRPTSQAQSTLTIQAFFQQPAGGYSAAYSWQYQYVKPVTPVNVPPTPLTVVTLAAGDMNGDGLPEIAVHWGFVNTDPDDSAGDLTTSSESHIDLLNGRTGAVFPKAAGALNPDPGAGVIVERIPPVIGDVTGDGVADVLYIDITTDYQMSGAKLVSGILTKEFSTLLPGTTGYRATPVLAELRAGHPGLEVLIADGAFSNTVGNVYLCNPTAALAQCGTANGGETSLSMTTGIRGIALADLDGNGNPEIIINGRNGASLGVIMDTAVASNLAAAGSLVTRNDDGGAAYLWNTPAVGDVDGGNPEIVNVEYSVFVDDAPKWGDVLVRGFSAGAFQDKGLLPRRGTTNNPQSQGGGGLVDLTKNDGNGYSEFVFGSMERQIVAVKQSAGAPIQLWTYPAAATTTGVPIAPISMGDTTGDCRPEILSGMDNGNVLILKGNDASGVPGAPDITGVVLFPYASPGDSTIPTRQAKIFWSAPVSDGGIPILSYRVYRAPSNDGTGTYTYVGSWAGAAAPDGTTVAMTFIDASMTAYGDYSYKVAAVNCIGEGSLSTYFWSEVKVPQKPINLAGSSAGGPSIVLTWTIPDTTPGAADKPNGCGLYTSPTPPYVLTYNVYRRGPPFTGVVDIPGPPIITGVTATTWTDFGVTSDASYDYEVTALNCVGESPHSNLVTVTVGTPPDAPTGLKVQPYGAPVYGATNPPAAPCQPPALAICKSVRLDWNAVTVFGGCPSITGYKVYRSPAGPPTFVLVGTVLSPATTFTDVTASLGASPSLGNTFDYAVTAYCTSPAFQSAQSTVMTADVKRPFAPSAPVANAISATTIRVSWADAGANNANCNGWEEGYYLFKGTNAGAISIYQTIQPAGAVAGFAPPSWRAITNPATAPGTAPALFFDDTAVAPGNTYVYQVAAINCVDQSFVSPVSVAAPFGLVAMPYGDPAYAVAGPKKVQLDWTAVGGTIASGGCSSGIEAYAVYRDGVFLTDAGAATTFTDSTVVAGSTYTYNIHGYCNTPVPYKESGDSFPATAAVTVPNTPAAPTAILLTGPPRVRLAWTDPGANNNNCNWEEGYRIYRQDNGVGLFNPVGLVTGTPQSWTIVPVAPRALSGWGAPTTAPPLQFDDTTILAGNTYAYAVSAVNCVGESLQSPVAGFITPIAPLTPTSLTARPFGNPAYSAATARKVQLDWTGLTGAEWSDCTAGNSYNIYRGAAGGPYTLEKTVADPITTWTDNGLVPGFPLTVGSTYGYVVHAACTAPIDLESTASTEATADVTLPALPVLAAPASGPGPSVTLTWSAPAPNNNNCNWLEGYHIYRGTAGPGSEGATPYATVFPSGVTSWPRALYGVAPATPATTFIDTGVSYAASYYYTVAAVNCLGKSAASIEAGVNVPANVPPVAEFSMPTTAAPNADVMFTDASSDSDGTITCYLWDFGDGTTSTVASPVHVYTAEGLYTVTLTICDNAGAMTSVTHSMQIAIPSIQPGDDDRPGVSGQSEPADEGPGSCNPLVADAGDDVTIDEDTINHLAGSACRMTHAGFGYAWSQVSGVEVALLGDDAANATFVAPMIEPGQIVVLGFALTVSQGAISSPLDYVNVTVRDVPGPAGPAVNQPPLAYAGVDLTVKERGMVTLDASSSGDPDDDAVTFAWTQLDGPLVTLSDATSATPTFVAPAYGPDHELRFVFEVSDGQSVTADIVVVTVAPPVSAASVPIAPGPTTGGFATMMVLWIGLALLATRSIGWVKMAEELRKRRAKGRR